LNILLTCVGRRGYLARYFTQACPSGSKIIGVDADATAPGFAACDEQYMVRGVSHPDYIDDLLSICKQHQVKLLLSLNDLELPILSQHRERFTECGVKAIVSDQTVIDRCFDKFEAYKWLRKNNIPTPHTVLGIDAALRALRSGQLSWPLMVKPRWGSASMGIFSVDNEASLRAAWVLAQQAVSNTTLTSSSPDDQEKVIIQQKLDATEYGIDVLNDFQGVPRQVIARRKVAMRAGETDKACVINSEPLFSLGERLGVLMKHIGNLDCDVFWYKGEPWVLEMNPRFGGGYPFSHAAGANFPAALVAWADGRDFDFNDMKLDYDLVYSKADELVQTVYQPEHQAVSAAPVASFGG